MIQDAPLVTTYLLRAREAGRLAHAYLLWGPGGAARDAAAERLARGLICAEGTARSLDPCGRCRPCREAAAGTHIGFVPLPADNAHIEIDDIRALTRTLAVACQRLRVIFIPSLERLTPPAAHAFLKILEEPGGSTLYLMTSGRLPAIIPTILSRCHRLPFFTGAGDAPTPPQPELDALLGDPRALAGLDLSDLLRTFEGTAKRDKTLELFAYVLGRIQTRMAAASAGAEPADDTLFGRAALDALYPLAERVMALAEDLDWNVSPDRLLESFAAALARCA